MAKPKKTTKGAAKAVPLPPATRDEYNNPVWNLLVNVEVTRCDHSIGMGEYVADLKDKATGQRIGDVSTLFGGFGFGVAMMKVPKGGHGHGSFVLNCKAAVLEVAELSDHFAKEPELPHPQSAKGKALEKKRA